MLRPAAPFVNTLTGSGVLGIDIGTSSIKIVQLSKGVGAINLDSYGSVELADYRDAMTQSEGAVAPDTLAAAIMDLIHSVALTSRVAGVSLPASLTMIRTVEMPNRDEEQLKKLMYAEVQKYIPGRMEDISLDWFVLPDESASRSVFDTFKAGAMMVAKPQTVLFAAMPTSTIKLYDNVMIASNLSSLFYEIEAFSGARAVLQTSPEPMLMIDIGSSTSAFYVVEQNIVRTLHAVDIAGAHLTASLATAMKWNQKMAEEVKCTYGLIPSPSSSAPENAEIKKALVTELDKIVSEARRVIDTYYEQHKKTVADIVLLGGGARMAGITGYMSEQLHVPVEVARPFDRVTCPIILESAFKSLGPIYTNAIGLALRAVG